MKFSELAKGRRASITIPATAGNIIYNALSPGEGKIWKILYGRVTLDTDGNAATRNIVLSIRNAAGTLLAFIPRSANIIMNQLATIELSPTILGMGTPLGDDAVNVYNTIGCIGLIVYGTDILRITISNGLAGDSYNGILTVQEVAQ